MKSRITTPQAYTVYGLNSAKQVLKADRFEIITIDIQNMGLMDDAHVEALRVPPEPRTITGNVGNEEFSERQFNKVKDTKFYWEL